MTTAPKSISFGERHPTSVKFDKVTGAAMGALVVYSTLIFAIGAGGVPGLGQMAMLIYVVGGVYLGYRFGKRVTTTVTVTDGTITVQSVSAFPFMNKPPKTYKLARETSVELEGSLGWWIPNELPLMDGDDHRYFFDIFVMTVDENNTAQHVLISRDRRPKNEMMARRDAVERLLQSGS